MPNVLERIIKSPVSYLRWLLGYDGIPPMARPAFRYDLLSSLFVALGQGAIIPALTTQFARRGLGAPEWIVAVLVAQASLGNLLNSFFAQDIARRRRVPLFVMSRIGIGMFLFCIAAMPAQQGLAGAFAALLVTPYLLHSIAFNIQNIARHSNYPGVARGRIFSRLSVINFTAMGVSALLGGYCLDNLGPWGHRLVFCSGAVMMILSAFFFSKMRIRGERAIIRRNLERPLRLLSGFKLLLEDRPYCIYMMWQNLFGWANNMCGPIMPLLMTDYLKVNYSKGMTALIFIPFLIVSMAGPFSGRLFDHINISKYRGINAFAWAGSKFFFFLGAFLGSWPLILTGSFVKGLGISMGNIAYNLGHTSFTTPERSHDYLGIHLTLQGIRGIIAPFIGVALLKTPGIGLNALLIAAGVMVMAGFGFFFMSPLATSKAKLANSNVQSPLSGQN